MICVPCSMEFPDDAIFLVHKKSGHIDKSKGLPIVGPGVEPNPEFVEAVNRIEARKDEPPPVSTHPERPKLPDPRPITLTYNYLGDCPVDRSPPTTIELDIEDKHFAVAICPNCKKQLASQQVEKL